MWLGYRQGWGWLDGVDSSTLNALHDFGVTHPWWVQFWEVFCVIFGPGAFRLFGVVAIVVALKARQLRTALFLLFSVELGGVVTVMAKGLADRPRPSGALVFAPSTAFPSGHAVAVMVGVLALLTVTAPLLSGRMRRAALIAGALIVIAIGFRRVALNVHHPSDVLAGWALGYLYFFVCLRIFRPPSLTASK